MQKSKNYTNPETEVITISFEDCILSTGQNEKPEIDNGFPGGDED